MKEFGVESYGYDPLLSTVEKKEKDVIIRVYNAINHRKTRCRIRIEFLDDKRNGTEQRELSIQTLRKFDQKRCAEAGIRYVERRNWDAKTRLLSSIEKAKKLLDCKPQMEFEDGLKKVHEWFVENWEDIDKNAEF
ncbi:MAG: hypothetical protein KAV25_09325 [Methanophagales archaeon]|nr:hypothetical protein [Methanophagales archaeon]